MKKLFLLSAILLGCTLSASQASAHATPLQYDPPSSSLLPFAPGSVYITFSERVEPTASSIEIYAPDGKRIEIGNANVDPKDEHGLTVKMNGAGSGTYAVSWGVVSADDGHFTKGAFVFSVGIESTAPDVAQFQVQHRSSWPEALAIWIELLGQAILLGSACMIALVWRTLATKENETFAARRLRMLIWSSLALVTMGTLSYLTIETFALANDRSVTAITSLTSFVQTASGTFLLLRLCLTLFVSAVFLTGLRAMLSSKTIIKREIILLVLMFLIGIARARVSHAAASEFYPTLSVLMNAVHLLAKDAWVGGVIVFVFVILPALKKLADTRTYVSTLLRLSNVLLWSLVFGGTSGAYIVWLHLKSPLNINSTHWGGYFIALLGYGTLLLGLRLAQEFQVFPALARRTGNMKESAVAVEFFLRTEMLVGIAVLLFSSVIMITTPPLSMGVFYEQKLETKEGTIVFTDSRPEPDKMMVLVERPEKIIGTGTVITVTLTNEEKGIGPIVAQTSSRFPGAVVFPMSDLTPSGVWKIDVTEHEEQLYDVTGTFTIDTDEMHAFHKNALLRQFGSFEVFLIIVSVGLICLALVLNVWNRQLAKMNTTETSVMEHVTSPVKSSVLIGLVIIAFLGLTLGRHDHGRRSFRDACAFAGGMWHEGVPMRDGQATSPYAALGCMVGMGRGTFHFTDEREFTEFTKHSFAYATLSTEPKALIAGSPSALLFTLKKEDGTPAEGLTYEHDRILHAVIMSEDLTSFQHLHVENDSLITDEMLKTGIFPVKITFPKPGTYLVATDFTVRAQTFGNTFRVTVGGSAETPIVEPGDDVTVSLTEPVDGLRARVTQKLQFEVTDSAGPVTDLEPYLSAAMHLSIVRTDLKSFVHTHAEPAQSWWDATFNPRDPHAKHVHIFLPDRLGPRLVSYIFFPQPGTYEIFSEGKRNNEIFRKRFTVDVR